MRNTKDAIRYGIETLNVTPKELFNLIESSNGYDGDDYKRWLAARIIEIAEADDVGFSQLLAKWFNIIQSMIEEYSDDSVKPQYMSLMKDMLGDEVYTVGFSIINEEESKSTFGDSVDETCWFDGRDIPWNAEFVENNLDARIRDAIVENRPVTLFCHFNKKESLTKSSEIFQDAKQMGIVCKDNNGLMLYRVCSMVNAIENQYGKSNFKFAFFADTEFLYNKDNQSILRYFLSYFKYKGFVVNSKELYSGSYTSENYVFCVCETRSHEDEEQNGFVLQTATIDGDCVTFGEGKRYSDGKDMLGWLKERSPEFNCKTVVISRDLRVVGTGKGAKGAYGYLCRGDKDRSALLSSYPIEDTQYFAITDNNIYDVIVYYGLMKAMQHNGLPGSITEVVSGHPDYWNLVYNCLPIFLFDPDTLFCDMGTIKTGSKTIRLVNRLDVIGSEVVKRLLDEGSIYFSYEAKELLGICKGYLDFLNEDEDMTGKTFAEIRKASDNVDLNKIYIRSLSICKDYVCSLYRQM